MEKPNDIKILEQGDIYFFYRPKVRSKDENKYTPRGIDDVQQFYIILKPENDNHYRLLIIGKKRLPKATKHQKYWAYIDLITTKKDELLNALKAMNYETKTRGERFKPATRPCGEGIYCIVKHGSNTYLPYKLELPKKTGEVQRELNIEPESSYIISIKNQAITPTQSGKAASFPKNLQEKFRNLRFIPVDPTTLLNYQDAELLLIGAHKNIEDELNIQKKLKDESLDTADIFNKLKLWKNEHTIKPLFSGKWQ